MKLEEPFYAGGHVEPTATKLDRPIIKHLYVHVPFCTHICPYCSFYKTPNSLPQIKEFIPALKLELQWARENFDFQLKSVFFGGGTPSALSLSQLETVFSDWSFEGVQEVTMEANPMTLSEAKASLLKEIGFNRISLGVQAFDDSSLKILGRTHNEDQVRRTVSILRAAGFNNLNLDLMFALPGQTPEQWLGSLQKALELKPQHISAYNLNYEEDTEFFHKLQAGKLHIDESQERNFFTAASDYLRESGFEHYEISNYSLPGYASLHNYSIWEGSNYLGLGPSACSTVNDLRWKNVPNTLAYADHLLKTKEPRREFEVLSKEMKKNERILLGMRTHEGINLSLIAGKETQINDLIAEGLLEIFSQRLRLTSQGKLVSDSITALLI